MYGGTTLDRYLQENLDRKIMGSNYLTKSRHGVRSNYANVTGDKENLHGKNKKNKIRKSIPKMSDYGIKKRMPDYTELAYKEAVTRLRYFLSESYVASSRSSKVGAASVKNLDDSGDETYDLLTRPKYPISFYGGIKSYNPVVLPPSKLAKRYPFYPKDNYRSYLGTDTTIPVNDSVQDPIHSNNIDHNNVGKVQSGDPELMGFIQKQEEYIEQLERESSYCRDELNNLLGKVKEVISENESLHEKQKNQLISSVMDHRSGLSESDDNDGDSIGLENESKYMKKKYTPRSPSRLEGPNIVFESKISELEAQLTQSNINLKKLQEENNEIKRKHTEINADSPCLDSFKRQIDNLQRDKSSLEAQVARLKDSLDDRKDCDSDLVSKIKRSSDLAYQANYDKAQLEMEIRRLKDELERQQTRVRELLGEQTRRVMEERNAVERRYCSQVEQLTSDLTTHWDSATKLQLELERQKREESDLKRELLQKNSQIEDLKLELKNKISSLQADIAQAHADRSAIEEELANARLMLERHQRQAKHDANRLNSEVQSVRQRLDRADADLVHSRRENLRLIEQIANMEKEMNLRSLRPSSPVVANNDKDKEISNRMMDMESKHAQTVSELEAMVCSQNSLMEKLTAECHLLTSKLDDASQKHKQEMASLQNKLEDLSLTVQSQNTINNDKLHNIREKRSDNQSTYNNTKNDNQYPQQVSNGGYSAPAQSDVQPGPDYGDSTVNNYDDRFDKPFKQSEEAPRGVDLNPSQVYDSDSAQNLASKEHPSTEQNLFGEEQDMDYAADQYPTNQDYDNQQYEGSGDQYQNQQYDQQYVDPNQEQYSEQYATDGQYDATPNQQYEAGQNQQYEAGQNQQYDAGQNQQYDASQNQQYDAGQDQQYDPNYVEPNP